MNKTILQVPISTDLRKDAEKQALEQGFSSLQEAVRVFLKKLGQGVIGITLRDEEDEQLSPRAIKRYKKISEDFKKGKNVHAAKSVDDLMRQLHESSLS